MGVITEIQRDFGCESQFVPHIPPIRASLLVLLETDSMSHIPLDIIHYVCTAQRAANTMASCGTMYAP